MDESDELSLTIGRIVRAAAHLEFNMGHLWTWLTGPSLAAYVKPKQMNVLVEDAKVMLQHVGLTHANREAARQAVVEAKNSYDLRSRAVHDIWFRADADTSEWTRQPQQYLRLKDPGQITATVTIDQLHADLNRIQRAAIRIGMLTMAVTQVHPPRPDVPVDGEDVVGLWAIVRDQFELMPGGGIRVTESKETL